MNFKMKKPCANCPFLKEGAIELAKGRLESIIESLMNDHNHFQCHKTVHGKQGGEWFEDENGEERYEPSGNESQCVGSMIYLLKAKAPNVTMRLAASFKMLSFDELMKQANDIIDPATGDKSCNTE